MATAAPILTSNAGLNRDLDISGLGLPPLAQAPLGQAPLGQAPLGQAPLGQALGSVLAKGALLGGTWQVAGEVGSIAARSVGSAWTGSFAGEAGVVQTSGDFAGTLAASSLRVLAVGRGLLCASHSISATPPFPTSSWPATASTRSIAPIAWWC